MADIVLGIGTSHSPMLSTPFDAFTGHADRDRARVPNFDALVGEKAAWIGRELRPEVAGPRHEATQAAIARLGDILAEASVDVLVVVGDDQAEWFSADSQPALCIYWGDAVENLPPPVDKMAPSLRRAYWGYYGDGTNRTFPVDGALGRHLVETLTREHEFDVAHVRVQPRHAPFGHAWSFVHQRIMGERVVPDRAGAAQHVLPAEPADAAPLLPARPRHPRGGGPRGRRPKRVGRASPRAASATSWSTRSSIATCSIVLARRDAAAIAALPLDKLDSGNSEIRNWIATAGAVGHLEMKPRSTTSRATDRRRARAWAWRSRSGSRTPAGR